MLEISLLSDMRLVNIFSHSIVCLFVLLTVSFALQNLLSFRRFYLFTVAFSVSATVSGLYLRNGLLCPCIEGYFPLFLCQVQCGPIYIEVFNPFGFEFCAWG